MFETCRRLALFVLCVIGTMTAILNGTQVCASEPSDVTDGAIGLQSEGFEVHFRRIRVRAE